mmetsp:Transcript_99770/g.321681  ORF Transcript_99770/g.321681 Transcript_99770/m.321681 type:complete len:240 (+) Transcript_99770:441-1160(+)
MTFCDFSSAMATCAPSGASGPSSWPRKVSKSRVRAASMAHSASTLSGVSLPAVRGEPGRTDSSWHTPWSKAATTFCFRSAAGTTCVPSPPNFSQAFWISSDVGVANRTLSSRPWPYLDLICCAVPRHRNCPSTWMAMREQRASASSMEWVVRTTVWPLLRILITFQRCRFAPASTAAEGSSRKRSEEYPINAMPRLSFRFMPPLYWPVTFVSAPSKPNRNSSASTVLSNEASGTPLMRP